MSAPDLTEATSYGASIYEHDDGWHWRVEERIHDQRGFMLHGRTFEGVAECASAAMRAAANKLRSLEDE